MVQGYKINSTPREGGVDVWSRWEFPVYQPDLNGLCEKWFAARNTLRRPFCFTPQAAFEFGNRRFIPLYPCIAFATRNFGFIIQRKWDGITIARM